MWSILFVIFFNEKLFISIDDSWLVTMRTVDESPNMMKNFNTTFSLRRSKERKKEKDRDRDRGREQEKNRERIKQQNSDRDILIKNLKNVNSYYEDFDYSLVNKQNNVGYVEQNVDQSSEKKEVKYLKGLISNKLHGVWPFHSNKDINNYYGNKTEPKYYLGTYFFRVNEMSGNNSFVSQGLLYQEHIALESSAIVIKKLVVSNLQIIQVYTLGT